MGVSGLDGLDGFGWERRLGLHWCVMSHAGTLTSDCIARIQIHEYSGFASLWLGASLAGARSFYKLLRPTTCTHVTVSVALGGKKI